MAVRPNITSMTLEGADLVVRGESPEPLPAIIQVVVVQDGATEDGRGFEVGRGGVERVALGWKATLPNTNFNKGPADAMGIQIRVSPFESCSWVQSLDIE
jgi:hypothetical protein